METILTILYGTVCFVMGLYFAPYWTSNKEINLTHEQAEDIALMLSHRTRYKWDQSKDIINYICDDHPSVASQYDIERVWDRA